MRYYSGKYKWVKVGFVVVAVLIITASLFMLNRFVNSLSELETRRVGNWAEATRLMAKADADADLTLELKVINDNTDIPVILVDSQGRYIDGRNIEIPQDTLTRASWTQSEIKKFGRVRKPIVIEMSDGSRQYVYYDESMLVYGLRLFTIGALSIIVVFTVVLLLFLLSEWRSEQDTVWVGMSKETAHQLGTPISSLSAWIELFKLRNPTKEEMVSEMSKDVDRLKIIADRFSKIGSRPKLQEQSVKEVVMCAVSYMRGRVSKHIDISVHSDVDDDFKLPLNEPLFEWVIENLCKNAVDSIGGKDGRICLTMREREGSCEIEVEDTGSGVSKSRWGTIFKSGYTTKKRGWGLGLSFAKRIIEEFHYGRIYVKRSEEGKGTTFAIILFNDKKSRYEWTKRNFMKKIIK